MFLMLFITGAGGAFGSTPLTNKVNARFMDLEKDFKRLCLNFKCLRRAFQILPNNSPPENKAGNTAGSMEEEEQKVY